MLFLTGSKEPRKQVRFLCRKPMTTASDWFWATQV
jgi:hypothetical protein